MHAANKLSLNKIPGVGEKTLQQLLQAFGDESRALEALLEPDLPRVAAALGSERRAIRLARQARAALYGYTPDEVLATNDAAAIYSTIVSTLSSLASSKPAKAELQSLTPAPSYAVHTLRQAMEPLQRLSARLQQEALPALRHALSRLTWPREDCAKHGRIILATPERVKELQATLRGYGVDARIVAVEELSEEHLREYSPGDVVVYDPDSLLPDDHYPVARSASLSQLAPEAVIEYVVCNRDMLEAILEAHRLQPRAVEEALKLAGAEPAKALEAARKLLTAAQAYGAEEFGKEYGRLKRILQQLDRVATDVEVWANEEARRRLEDLELRMTGADMLRLLDAIEAGEIPIPQQILEVLEEVALEAENKLAEELGLSPEEASELEGIIVSERLLPMQVRREKLEALRRSLAGKAAVAKLKALQRLASGIENATAMVPKIYRALKLLDVAQALKAYAAMFTAETTSVETSWLGVGLVEGRELELVKRLGPERVQPVDYSIGCTGYRPQGTACENIVLLTGANSGGKTTLLRLVAEATLAAQMGLPAPARKAYIGPFDKVYYISKPTGMLSAGALETLLKRLAKIVEEARHRRVLVLVDELEAVTEANAAARILSAFIESLVGKNTVALLVTHMAEDVVKLLNREARHAVRIDGIEARGLDENYNLIVDRRPRYNHLARSTPELVVKKLLKKSKGGQKEFFKNMLSKMTR